MAEGLGRAQAPAGWQVYSAGSRPGRLHPLAVETMNEVGIDLSHHYSKGLDAVPLAEADVVITLCAEEDCPVAYTGARRLNWAIPDPAAPRGSEDEQREAFRTVRDTIKQRLQDFWREHEEPA